MCSFFQPDKASLSLPLGSQWLWDLSWPSECSTSGTAGLLIQASWYCVVYFVDLLEHCNGPMRSLPSGEPMKLEVLGWQPQLTTRHVSPPWTIQPQPSLAITNCSSMNDLRWDSQKNFPAEASPECRIMNNCFKPLNMGFVIQQLIMDIPSKINTYSWAPFSFYSISLALFHFVSWSQPIGSVYLDL